MPDLTWTGDRFDLTVGGITIELHHFGPSHGSGMTVFLLPAQDVVFVTDIAAAGRLFPMHMPDFDIDGLCLLYTSPSPRDGLLSRMPSSA